MGFKKKRKLKADGELKGTASTLSTIAHATGLRWAIYSAIPAHNHAAAWAHATSRRSGHGLKKMQLSENKRPVEGLWPGANVDARTWLRDHAVSSSYTNRSSTNVIIPEPLFSYAPKTLLADAEEEILAWAELLQNHEVRFDIDRGLHIVAASAIKRNAIVCRGFVEATFVDGGSATGAGTLLGPSSLVNSACSLCSNAKYTCNWNVKTTRRVPAGAQFLTNYAQPGVDLFCREIVPGVGGSSVICGKKIGGSR